MQLRSFLLVTIAAALCATALPAAAQSLSPMRKEGTTPSDAKGYKLIVGNPYDGPMIFQIIPMDPSFTTLAKNAKVNFPEIKLAPGAQRQVIVTFGIDPGKKERTIGVCVQPKNLESSILPRVCGTYTGRRLGASS